MGLFDEFTDIFTDLNSIKKEFVEFGAEVVKDIMMEAKEVKQTVVETAETFTDETASTASTIKQATTINVTHITQTAASDDATGSSKTETPDSQAT